MRELIADEKRTVLIVSHDLRTLEELCDEILWLDEGRVMRKGPAGDVLGEYRAFMGLDSPKPPAKPAASAKK